MTERFYNIKHLSTGELQELYTTYIKKGWKDFDYYQLMPQKIQPQELSDAEVILNLDAEHKHNYCVFMIDCTGERDGIMFGFGLSYYPDFAVYLHLPVNLLDEIVDKYSLIPHPEVKDQTVAEYLLNRPGGFSLN
ncbi:hypothetical protein [Dysgonomonas sp. ZJ709]|uniref:hypothetical protein n=1 Tax=Dysgonomonas sp. ZJ709 TaxID=2709797 RepID=UPI0013EA56D8|nr:hypothetical protein [Dysgonomonas sp. ZJ709]